MSVQNRTDFTNYSIFTDGDTLVKDNETILQDGARATVLKRGTVMAQVAATRKWVPLTDVTATTGAAIARGIYVGPDIAAASLVAGDVKGPIVVGGYNGCTADSSMLTLENSVTLATVRGATTVNACVVEDDLARIGIFVKTTYDVMNLEN